MLKKNFNLKLKIKNPTNPSTPAPIEQKTFLNINSCPIQNNKLHFNYIFRKENKNDPNKMAIQFNNRLMNDNNSNGIKANIDQHNLNNEFVKAMNPSEINNNHKKEQLQMTEEKNKKIHPIIQNILINKVDKIKRNYPKIKKIKNINKIPIQENKNPDNYSKSNNLLPLVNKGNKKIQNTNNQKHLFHNKSGGNIKINIDCALKKKFDENYQINNNNLNNVIFNDNDKKEDNNNDLNNLLINNLPVENNKKDKNNILINNIQIDNEKNSMNNLLDNNREINKNNNININDINNQNENNILKLRNRPNLKHIKLKNFFYKEDQNIKHNNKSMEDFILVKNPFLNNLSLFALFDGHGGKNVAEYLKNNFCDVLTKKIKENQNLHLTEILKDTIISIDKDIEKLNNVKECGSTGTIVIIDNDMIYSVNVGDSKSFYINDKEAIQMTEDHNCQNKIEVERVKKKNVKVFNGRVFGCLCLTRTFGDTDFKECGIDCEPHIQEISINENKINYIVIASDGIWDIVDDKQLFKMKNELKNENSEEFCNNLVEYSLKGGSKDNISCIVLKFDE